MGSSGYTNFRDTTRKNIQLLLQNIENIVSFVPPGLAIGWLCRDAKPWEYAIAIAGVTLFSLSIETLHLHYVISICDVDDVIDNVLGTILGFVVIWMLCKVTRPKKDENA